LALLLLLGTLPLQAQSAGGGAASRASLRVPSFQLTAPGRGTVSAPSSASGRTLYTFDFKGPKGGEIRIDPPTPPTGDPPEPTKKDPEEPPRPLLKNDFGFVKTSFALPPSTPFAITLIPKKTPLQLGQGVTMKWWPSDPPGEWKCADKPAYDTNGKRVSDSLDFKFTPPTDDLNAMAALKGKQFIATLRQQTSGTDNPTSTLIFTFAK
jgi:hypothetical protein